MNLLQKTQRIQFYLNFTPQNHSDTFKQETIIYFDKDFTLQNPQFYFLKTPKKKEIE